MEETSNFKDEHVAPMCQKSREEGSKWSSLIEVNQENFVDLLYNIAMEAKTKVSLYKIISYRDLKYILCRSKTYINNNRSFRSIPLVHVFNSVPVFPTLLIFKDFFL